MPLSSEEIKTSLNRYMLVDLVKRVQLTNDHHYLIECEKSELYLYLKKQNSRLWELLRLTHTYENEAAANIAELIAFSGGNRKFYDLMSNEFKIDHQKSNPEKTSQK